MQASRYQLYSVLCFKNNPCSLATLFSFIQILGINSALDLRYMPDRRDRIDRGTKKLPTLPELRGRSPLLHPPRQCSSVGAASTSADRSPLQASAEESRYHAVEVRIMSIVQYMQYTIIMYVHMISCIYIYIYNYM